MQKSITKSRYSTRRLTAGAMFAAISALLMYLEFPLPLMPPFLKLDLSGVAILIAAFMFGPWQAVIIALIKNLVRLMSTQTGGVGEFADFIMLSCFAVTASLIYNKYKDRKHAIIGCFVATMVLGLFGVIANKFLLIPFYSKIMPLEAIIGACSAVNPAIDSLNAYYLLGVLPFNLIKGATLSAVTVLCYKKLSAFIKRNQELSVN